MWPPGSHSQNPSSWFVFDHPRTQGIGRRVADAENEENTLRSASAEGLSCGPIVLINGVVPRFDVQNEKLPLVLRHHLRTDVTAVDLLRDPADLLIGKLSAWHLHDLLSCD